MPEKPISLELDDLFRKIVINHRGGYCFEMNGLFAGVLTEWDFWSATIWPGSIRAVLTIREKPTGCCW